MAETVSRRKLVGSALALSGLPAAGAKSEGAARSRRASAQDKVVLGLIGAGGMGRANLFALMDKPGVEVAAICDVDQKHLDDTVKQVQERSGKTPAAVKDFRKLLEMKEIDGVIIGTPDHWHALPTIYACEAGKDVYCEKPISHNIVEGVAMVNAARKFKRVVQVGTWQRSTQSFVDAVDYVRSGKLGKITLCRAWTLGGAGTGKVAPTEPPSNLDYDFWVGPAAFEPYQANRCHGSFRWYFNYAGGLTGDWGVHMIDIVLLGMSQGLDLTMPKRVSSVGGKIASGADDDRTTPDTQQAVYRFDDESGSPSWLMQWEVRVGGQGLDLGPSHGSEFIGQNGRLMAWRNDWKIWTPDGKELERPKSQNPVSDHWQNWLDCIKSREKPRSDIGSMFQTTTVCHLANVAYLTGESLEWDNASLQVSNSRRAMDCLCYRREYRKPWKLPMHKL